MSFRTRILFALGAVGLVPLSLAASFSFAASKTELERTVGRAQAAAAAEAARGCERFIARALESLRMSAGMLPLGELTRDETAKVLGIPYRQRDFVRALALLDYDGGLLASPVAGPRLAGVPGDPAQVQRFLSRVPLRLAIDAGTAIGSPYRSDGESRIAVALQVRGQRAVVAAEVSLGEIEQRMRQLAGDDVARVVDARGDVLAGNTTIALTGAERDLVAAAAAGRPVSRVVAGANGTRWLASAAPVPQIGWTVLVAQPTDEAFRPAHHVRFYSAFWAAVALLLIAVLGVVLSRGLTGPMEKLSHAVAQLGDGRYDVDLDIKRGDEIGRFADAFRRMAGDLRRRDDEIRRWNAELQARVDQGTRELRTAQDQILRTRRLAALGSLGAGIAHELNNPLTAVTGLLTILRLDLQPGSPQAATIQQALDQSFRMAKIVSELRAFAEQERGEGRTFPLDGPVRAALDLYAGQLAKQNIRVVTDLEASTRHAQGDPGRIQRAVANVVENAIQAMPEGGELKVQLTDVDGEALKLSISDTGAGIPSALRERIFDPFFTTKKSGAGVGMGLSVSHSIVEAHHGRIVVESEEGKGATFTIFLPAAAPAAHLA